MTQGNAGTVFAVSNHASETCAVVAAPRPLDLAVVAARPLEGFDRFVRQAGLDWTTTLHVPESLERSSDLAADATIVDVDEALTADLAGVCNKLLSVAVGPPILVFTKHDTSEARAELLALGVSDVLSALLQNPRELTIRVETAVRVFSGRSRPFRTCHRVRFGDVELELGSESVWLSGRPLPLTLQQRSILMCLARQPDAAVSYEHLYQTSGIQRHATHANIHNQVSRLRKRLGPTARNIVGLPGVGVVLKVTSG